MIEVCSLLIVLMCFDVDGYVLDLFCFCFANRFETLFGCLRVVVHFVRCLLPVHLFCLVALFLC